MTATFHKFNALVENLAEKKIDLANDTLKVALTNTVPVATMTGFADLTEIAAGNGYSAGGAAVEVTISAQTGGTYLLEGTGPTFEASGGSMAAFRYAVLYDDTAAGKPLIGWWDYGSALTMAEADTFEVAFDDGIIDLA